MHPAVPNQAQLIADSLQKYDHILVAAHSSPDGDAIGATGAMGHILSRLGKNFILYNHSGCPDCLQWVPFPKALLSQKNDLSFKPELLVVLDCGTAERTGSALLSSMLKEIPSINIDHHLDNTLFASLANWADPKMAATGQMVAAVADALDLSLTGDLAVCLYLALVSDTGSFSHGNTDAAVFRLAARLMEQGLDGSAVRDQLDNQWSLAKTKLWSYLLDNIELKEDGRVAICLAPLKKLRSLKKLEMYESKPDKALREDMEGFVEQMRKIKGVRVAALIREDDGKHCRISMRSTGKDDVRAVTARFGGGGHRNAAGATVEMSATHLIEQLMATIKQEIL